MRLSVCDFGNLFPIVLYFYEATSEKNKVVCGVEVIFFFVN